MAKLSEMKGKTCLITGGTSGIGKVTARELARLGAEVVLAARDRTKADATVEELRAEVPEARLEVLIADLSSLAEVRKLAAEFRSRHSRLDVLVNNVGAIYMERSTTVDGFERTFGTNHLAPFLLTNELLELLERGAPARVINLSSRAHRRGRMHFDDLQLERGYTGWKAYSQSKLANILFTRELARRVEGKGITVNAVHPGVVATGFGKNTPGFYRNLLHLVGPFLLSPEKGAQTSIFLAASPEVEKVTGGYFVRSRQVSPSRAAQDPVAAARLWEISEKLVGLEQGGRVRIL